MTSAEDMGIWGNAILSRCEITKTDIKKINRPGRISKGKMALARNVLLAVVSIPGYGNLGRKLELDRALYWIEETNQDSRLAIFGGDFNFDRFVNAGSEAFMYEKIRSAGFEDAYADYMKNNGVSLETLCENEDEPDEHCTKGVTKHDKKNGRRIDYIFTKRPAAIEAARVVFNEMVNHDEPSVSDHAGVFIRLKLP